MLLVDLIIADTSSVVAFCHDHGIGLVVVGPEAPLVAGLANDLFTPWKVRRTS